MKYDDRTRRMPKKTRSCIDSPTVPARLIIGLRSGLQMAGRISACSICKAGNDEYNRGKHITRNYHNYICSCVSDLIAIPILSTKVCV